MQQGSGKYLEVDPGVEIYCEDEGSGSAIVFIPGWTFTTEMFIHQIQYFSKKHRVVLIDPRSHGRSSISPVGNDYLTHSNDLAKIFNMLDLTNVVLVAWSFGCLAAWGLTKRERTKNIRAMVSIDQSPKPLSVNAQDWVEGPLDEIASIYNDFLLSRNGQRKFVTWYAENVMVQRKLTPPELSWIVSQSLKTPHFIASALFAAGMFTDHLPEAKRVDKSIPALMIIAEHWAKTAKSFMNTHCPNTKTVILGGHMMFWEHADSFNKILEDFIDQLK